MALRDEILKQSAQIKTTSYQMSIGELINLYRDSELDVHPEFQRMFRWSNTQKTRLIESNLTSEVFKEIVLSLGLDYSRFSMQEKLIDEKLLHNRNEIAHGQYLRVDLAEYLSVHDAVFGMMQDFYDQVDSAAFAGAFRL